MTVSGEVLAFIRPARVQAFITPIAVSTYESVRVIFKLEKSQHYFFI